jgi:protein-tyrosine phosphatase
MIRTIIFCALLAAVSPVAVAVAVAAKAPAPAALAGDHALGLAGAPNFRDLGGYRTASGGTVKRGIVFRSSKLAALTPVDWARVRTLGIGHVYDLRTVEERRAEPDNWPAPAPAAYGSPKPDMSASIAAMKRAGGDPAKVRAVIRHVYAAMPTLYAPEYSAFFHGLADGDQPVVVHCTAGKDRTGVASALLLTALGVPRATVVGDYQLTERLLPQAPMQTSGKPGAPVGGNGAATLLAMPAATQKAMWAADPVYIAAALDAVTRRYGSIDGYMRKALGLSDAEIRRLRRRLID